MNLGDIIPYIAPTVVLLLILGSAIKILPEYERGVVFFLGRFQGVKGPGLIIVIPGIQQIVRVDLRVITLDVPSQDVISKDNVTVRVNAVLYFRVVDPEKPLSGLKIMVPLPASWPRRHCDLYWASTTWTRCYPNGTS